MSYSQYPTTNSDNNYGGNKDNRNIIYGLLIGALVLTWAYIFYDKSKIDQTIAKQETQIKTLDEAKTNLQVEYNLAVARYDSVNTSNVELQGTLAERNAEIVKLKTRIQPLLGDTSNYGQARILIKELNNKIDNLYQEIARLKTENKTLTNENSELNVQKEKLSTEKTKLQKDLTDAADENQKLNDKVDVASTFHVSDISLTPLKIRNSGKEVTTSTAKRVDLFRVSFMLDENRVIASGTKEILVCIIAPDGKTIGIPSLGNGTFYTRDGEIKTFSSKVSVNYVQNQRTPVSFDWKQDEKYATGDYKIEVYHNGFKIGEAVKTLKKGGLFG